MWAFLLHRITGLGLVFYLFLHIWVISSSLGGPKSFDRMLAFFQTPFFIILDLVLLAAILYHGFNGVRIILFDFGVGVRQQKFIFWLMMAIAIILFVTATAATVPHLTKGIG